MTLGRRWLTLSALVGVIATSCTSGGIDAEVDQEQDGAGAASEAAYLEAVEAAETVRGDAYGQVFDALQQTYPFPDRFLQILGEARFPEANARALEAAESLRPPERFEQEHRDWVARVRAELDLSQRMEEARAREDILDVVLTLVEIELDFGAGVRTWSEPFCRAVVQEFGGGDERVCPRGDSVPGREYGGRLRTTLLRLVTDVEPRISVPPVLDEEETFAWLAEVQPDVERAFEEMRAEVASLDPPPELADDHARILEFLEQIADVARRITTASEARDRAELERLFDESARPGDRLRSELSDEARPIVGVFFQEPQARE